jgi:hypothetical protein
MTADLCLILLLNDTVDYKLNLQEQSKAQELLKNRKQRFSNMFKMHLKGP